METRKSDGSRCITYREYIQEIAGSVLFSASQFSVNPGLSSMFAWLAGQALFYQQYRFKRLRFLYETEKGSSTNGKVMFAFQQDATDPVPTNKQELLENEFKAGGSPWQEFCLSVPMNKQNFALGLLRFIRGGDLSANLDQKTYDIGQLIVAVQGMADATVVGELYVEYEVELMTPIQSTAVLTAALSKTITGVSPADASFFGAAPTDTGGLDATATVNTITFNRVGKYLCYGVCGGAGMLTSYVPVVSASTAAVVVLAGGISNAAANAGTSASFAATVNVSARGQTAVFDTNTQQTTLSSSLMYVVPYSVS